MSSKVKSMLESKQATTVDNTDLAEKPDGLPPKPDGVYESSYCATCRPCCTLPHGWWSVSTAIVATIAWIFTLLSLSSCHYMAVDNFTWCSQPKPLYGTCGDCHCIRGDAPCPTGEDVPTTEFFMESVEEWKSLELENPMTIDCNPYRNETCNTVPPVDSESIALWEDAVCAVIFNTTNLDEDQCPASYSTQTYDSKEDAEADGAHVTHFGACATCSSLQDLAVYVENPDLTSLGQTCGLVGIVDAQGGIDCFADAGYTKPCATMWMYNVFQTRDKCFDTCIDFTFAGDPNNSPAPECIMADCLQCDEDYSGPYFKTYAGRTRRRSGLLSRIARPCDAILIVNHVDPCPDKLPANKTPLVYDQGVQCLDTNTNVGPISYADTKSNLFIDLGPLNDRETGLMKSQYETCTRFNFRRSVGGFWDDVEEHFGAAQRASSAFIVVATVLGATAVVLMWTTTCAAFKRNFWLFVVSASVICAVFNLLSLVIFTADVCKESGSGACEWKNEAALPIVAGCLWFVVAVLGFLTYQRRGHAKPGHTIACCCCPEAEAYFDTDETGPLLAGGGTTRVDTTETTQPDGTKVIEKVTTMPNGTKTVEINTIKSAASVGGSIFKGSMKLEEAVQLDEVSKEEDGNDNEKEA